MGIRPSELWGITWQLTAYFFDTGLRDWANFVDRTVNDAEVRVRSQMRHAKRANVDSFAFQAKQVAFHKLMGLPVESLYAAPTLNGKENTGSKSSPKVKVDLDKIPGLPRQFR